MDPDDPQLACFEAGIKFGSLYHQFAGTPVAPRSIDTLERAIEESIENQPFCESVSVTILEERVREAIDHDEGPASDSERERGSRSPHNEQSERAGPPSHGYTELTGSLMEVQMTIDYEGVTVETAMAMEDGYPRMRVVSVGE